MLGDCQQFTSKGPMNCFGRLSNKFASEGSPIYLPNLSSKFSRTKSFCLKTVILLAFGLGMCGRLSTIHVEGAHELFRKVIQQIRLGG